MECKICNAKAVSYFTCRVMNKYDVQYFRCTKCKFIQTEDPYWLPDAYKSAITSLDVGLVYRNEYLAPIVQTTISKWFNAQGQFIDYGGGYGLLVRMMRDRGFNFFRQDMYCKNLFAEQFDINDVPPFKASLLTAFEVFEHLTDPVKELEKMLAMSEAVMFSTEVQPLDEVSPDTWWYVAPETGQHISLYSRSSLYALADRFNLNYSWNEHNIHLFSKKNISNNAFKFYTHPSVSFWYNKLFVKMPSLIPTDLDFIKAQINSSTKDDRLPV
jgi:hypothetical protein